MHHRKTNNCLGVLCVVLLFCFIAAWETGTLHMFAPSTQASQDYSFTAYRASHHIPVPVCSLLSREEGGRVNAQGVILCNETDLIPTKAQINVWEGYVLWDSCMEYGSKYACDQLNN